MQQRFGASSNIITRALQKTAGEWHALGAGAPSRNNRVTPQNANPTPMNDVQTSSVQKTPPVSPGDGIHWQYRAVIVRGRVVLGDVVYEQQGRDGSDWKPLARGSFEQALDVFGKDGWQLASMVSRSHGGECFTGVYELAFKRPIA